MTDLTRRAMIAASSAAMLLPGRLRAQTGASPFSWNGLIADAKRLAGAAHQPAPINPAAARIDYDAFHNARFRDERALWGDLPGATSVRFFPLSGGVSQPVAINAVENGQTRPIAYDPAMFAMDAGNPVAALGPDAGFAGFRIMNAARDGDWLVFMGASYFRSSGAQNQYGLSARALAIDTSRGPEEFPRFTAFWLERTGESGVTVYALLDSPSIAGAYRFASRIDETGVHQDIDAALFPRRAIAELGLMPMTSMFWYDQAHRQFATDWRPEIHDSDGLVYRAANGAGHFRALANPPARRVTPFAERSPVGFGLVQRDRNFDHYQDDGVFYDRRPSLWATPRKGLGAGQIRLYEFPTDSEYTDNIAAYWTPAAPVIANRRIDLAYRLDWQAEEPAAASPLAKVGDIWRGESDLPGASIRLVADFTGLTRKTGISADATLSGGTVVKQAAYPLLGRPGTWRTVIDVAPAGRDIVDVQLALMDGRAMVSEILHYPLQP